MGPGYTKHGQKVERFRQNFFGAQADLRTTGRHSTRISRAPPGCAMRLSSDPYWQGAACSNLEFSKVECSVKLVTEGHDMKRIEQAVKDVWQESMDWQAI